MSSTQNQINYDKKYDILYYSLGDTGNSYGDEIDDKIVLLKDIETDALTGITVLDFIQFCFQDVKEREILMKYFDVQDIAERIL